MAKGKGGASGDTRGVGFKGDLGARQGRGQGGAGGWPSTKPGVPSGGNRSNAPPKR